MIEWKLLSSTMPGHWSVGEYDRGVFRRHIAMRLDKPTAQRIAKLLELESVVEKAIAWQKSFKHGRDVTDEGFSVADDAAEQALYEAAEAAGEEPTPASGNCPGCGAAVEEGPREDGYTRWACKSNMGAWGFGRSQLCWERREAAKAEGKEVGS